MKCSPRKFREVGGRFIQNFLKQERKHERGVGKWWGKEVEFSTRKIKGAGSPSQRKWSNGKARGEAKYLHKDAEASEFLLAFSVALN